jgi:hypothetical protein
MLVMLAKRKLRLSTPEMDRKLIYIMLGARHAVTGKIYGHATVRDAETNLLSSEVVSNCSSEEAIHSIQA